ncbi:hypothetical protein BH10CYA1_BH10CYA1_12200 [soil metagenome]
MPGSSTDKNKSIKKPNVFLRIALGVFIATALLIGISRLFATHTIESQLSLAKEALEKRQFDQSEEIYRKLLSEAKSNPLAVAGFTRAQITNQLANVLCLQNQQSEAIPLYKESLKILMLIFANKEKQHLSGVRFNSYREADAIARVIYSYAHALKQQNRSDEAEEMCDANWKELLAHCHDQPEQVRMEEVGAEGIRHLLQEAHDSDLSRFSTELDRLSRAVRAEKLPGYLSLIRAQSLH